MERRAFLQTYNVRQEKDGRWRSVFFLNGKKYDIWRKNKSDLISKVQSIVGGEFYTLRSVWSDFLDRQADFRRDGTLKNYDSEYKNFISHTRLCDIPLKRIKTVDIENFVIDCISIKPITERFFKELKGTLSQVFKYCIYKGWMEYNPTKDFEINKNLFVPAVHKKDSNKIFSSEEKERLKKQCYEHFKAFQEPRYLGLCLLFSLGLRVSELCALKWSDIEDGYIHIQREVIDKGKSIIDSTKTASGNRYLPLNSKSKEYLDLIKDMSAIQGHDLNSYIFLSKDGTYAKPYNFDKMIRRLQKHLAFTEVKSCHDVRRTFCTELFRSGVDIKTIQRIMGHSSIQMTYSYIMNEDLEDQHLLENIG